MALRVVPLILLLCRASAIAAPVNPSATTKTKQVLAYLQGLPKLTALRVVSGQNVGHGAKAVTGYNDFVVKLQTQTSQWVGLLGVDYGLTVDATGIAAANQVIKQHWAAGGLITVSIHFPNPFTGGDAWDRSGVDLTALLTPSSSVYSKWKSYLDTVAAGLAELRDAGVVVLWRPFHEMNGDWFWWSAKGSSFASPSEFAALWKQMFDYFTATKGLNNLLWVYAPNAQFNTSAEKTTTYYYPGSGLVDVVGLDVYLDDLSGINANQGMSSLLALGKPFGLTEFGPKSILDGSFDDTVVIKGIKTYAPQASFWLQWHSWSGSDVAIVDNQNAPALMTDPWVITRDKIVLPSLAPPPPQDSSPPPATKDAAVSPPAPPPPPPPPTATKDAAPSLGKDVGTKPPSKDAGVVKKDTASAASREAAAPKTDGGVAPAPSDAGFGNAASSDAARQARGNDSGDEGGAKCNLCSSGGPPDGASTALLLLLLSLTLARVHRRRS